MRILVLGDSHGRLDLVSQACTEAVAIFGIEAAIQVGDFGFSEALLARFLRNEFGRLPVPLFVIDGNHEDHHWLAEVRANKYDGAWHSRNLYVQRRGSITSFGRCRIGFLGGALHADRPQEYAGSWQETSTNRSRARHGGPRDPAWANWVTAGDVKRAIPTFGYDAPHIIISHSCPAGIGVGMGGAPELVDQVERFITRCGYDAGPFHDCGEPGLTRVWNALVTRPQHWLFGHFHTLRQATVGDTVFTCVGSTDTSAGVVGVRPVVIDTSTMTVTVDTTLRL